MGPEHSPVVVHFGCGQLGIGAVLPFLIHKYGSTHRIIAVQRRSRAWGQLPNDIILPILTSVGDFMPFRTLVFERTDEMTDGSKANVLKNGIRLLALVPGIWACHGMLDILTQNASNVIVSCSLGEAQSELIQLLKVHRSWEKILIFENTPAKGWEETFGSNDRKAFPVLVDRICWHIDGFSPDEGRSSVLSHCESPKYTRFMWQASADVPLTTDVKLSRVPGEVINFEGWSAEPFPDYELEWQKKKKRALVNAPHTMVALLCYRLLAARLMEGREQYLAPLQQMLRKERPQWCVAMDYYFRLRAYEISWDRWKNAPAMELNERLHGEFVSAHAISSRAEERFFASNDRLDRLMSRDKIAKELSKFREHILEPIEFYNAKRDQLAQTWVYGRPNLVELSALRSFLTETFLEATRWLASQG